MSADRRLLSFFFFNDTATTEIYTLSLHDALPIYTQEDFPEWWAGIQNNLGQAYRQRIRGEVAENLEEAIHHYERDRKSTRLNSSHANISYAVFCLKKKNKYVIDYLFRLHLAHYDV